jgi:hypothetical protein
MLMSLSSDQIVTTDISPMLLVYWEERYIDLGDTLPDDCYRISCQWISCG